MRHFARASADICIACSFFLDGAEVDGGVEVVLEMEIFLGENSELREEITLEVALLRLLVFVVEFWTQQEQRQNGL
jgi:hypothetical protein